MMINPSVVLFIVEGELDRFFYREFLDEFINTLPPSYRLEYRISKADIIAKHNPKGIKNSVEKEVNKALAELKFKKEDILFIAHLCDVDGIHLLVPDFLIDENDSLRNEQNYKYVESTKKIYCKNIDTRSNLLASWNIKKRNQGELISEKRILDIDYRLYYNSLFLEHYLTGKMPFFTEEKRDCLEEAMENIESFSGLKNFIISKALSIDYEESWNLLLKPENKMIRTSNLNIMFDNIEARADSRA